MTWLKVPLSQLSINKALMLNRHNTQNKDSVTEQITESVSNFNLEPFSIWKWVLNYWPAEIFSCAKSLVFSLGFSEHFPSLHLCSYLSTPRWQTKLNDLSPTSLTLLSLLRHISNRISLKTLPLSQTFFFFWEENKYISDRKECILFHLPDMLDMSWLNCFHTLQPVFTWSGISVK